MTWTPSPEPPVLQWSRPCAKCGNLTYRTTTGNLVNYRHQGAETECPKPAPKPAQPTRSLQVVS